jgi:hypothetical protein
MFPDVKGLVSSKIQWEDQNGDVVWCVQMKWNVQEMLDWQEDVEGSSSSSGSGSSSSSGSGSSSSSGSGSSSSSGSGSSSSSETHLRAAAAASTALLRLEAWRSAAPHLFERATPCLKHGLGTDRNGSTFRFAALAGFHGTFDLLDTPTELTGRDFAPALLLGWGHDDLVSLALPPFNRRRARLRFGCRRASLLCSFCLGIQPRTFGVLHFTTCV